MLKAASANRSTRIKVIEDGKLVKTVGNASINYGQDLAQLKKMIEIAIRLSPDDPVYNVEKIIISAGEGQEYEVDQKELELIQSTLFRHDAPIPIGAKISLTVHVKKPAPRAVSRGAASIRERMASTQSEKEIATPGASKYDNILRAPSPAPKRTTTPNKARSASRGRFTPSSNNLRGPSPARFPRCSTSSNDSDMTSRAPNRFQDNNREVLSRFSSRDSVSSQQSEKSVPSIRPSSLEEKKPENSTSASVPSNFECVSEEQNAVVTQRKTPLKSKRLSVLEVTEENKKIIEVGINQTWKEVDGLPGVKTPPRSFLGPFTYYSPVSTPNKAKEEIEQKTNDVVQTQPEPVSNPVVEENPESEEIVEVTEIPVENPVENSDPLNSSTSETPTQDFTEDVVDGKVDSGNNNHGTPKRTPLNSSMKSRKSFIHSNVASASKTPVKRLQTTVRPVYPDGKTLGESSVVFDNSLRTYSGNSNTRLVHTEMKKKPSASDFSPPLAKGHRRSNSFREGKETEGRPSIGTITSQWEFMRTNFVNNSDEELEWLMISKKTGAYHYAHKKLEQAEDKYFKSLYDIDHYETKLQHFTGSGAKFPALLQELANLYSAIMAQPKDEATGALVLTAYQKLCDYCQEVNSLDLFSIFPLKFRSSLTSFRNANDTNEKFKIVRKARDLLGDYQSDIVTVQSKLTTAKKDSEDALKNIEKWTKREIEVEEYPTIMKQQEQQFMEKEFDDNFLALQTIRSYFPNPATTIDQKNLFDMTVAEIQEEYVRHGGLISYELAQELKANKLLQWIITHPDDIAYANFLTGDKKTYFENIESYDLMELRAMAMVLPSKFENDNDNKKAEWRNRLMTRLKTLVSQYHGEKVKGCWDGTKNCRTMVQLPPLKPEQTRRSIYYFRTKEESDKKLKQYNDKISLLEKKKCLLAEAELEVKEAKEEYNTVLQEMRDPDFVELYGVEKLTSVKDIAKTELTNAEKKKKTLQQDVTRLEKSINEAPMTRDQFVEREEELAEFLESKGIPWREKGVAPVLIEGIFEPDRVIERQVKAAAKFLSAEEEAEQRRLELLSFKSRSMAGNSFDTENVNNPDLVHQNEEPSLTVTASVSQSLDEMLTNQNEILNEMTNNDTPVPAPFASPVKRGSILMNTNPDLINSLNKMLSGSINPDANNNVLRPKSFNRRATLGMMASKSSNNLLDENGENNNAIRNTPQPKEKKATRSKLLKRLFGTDRNDNENAEDGENSNPNKKPALPAMSFLDQIKARANGTTTEIEPVDQSQPIKPKNPLLAPGGGGGGLGGMSFLDQIKSRRKAEE